MNTLYGRRVLMRILLILLNQDQEGDPTEFLFLDPSTNG